MDKDFNQVNKQIAGFIVVSAAVVVIPVVSGSVQANPVMLPDQTVAPVMRYAGPQMPLVVRYAGPQIPDVKPLPTVRYAGPQMPPVMVKYAGPQMPPASEIIERYAGPQMQGADVNLNLNQNINVAPAANVVPNQNINMKPLNIENKFGLIQLDAGHYIYK